MKTKILLVGGFGYIGNQVYHHLSRRFDVHVIDNGSFGIFNYGEIGDHKNLSKKELSQYDAIVILSGKSSVQLCPDNKLGEVMENNVYAPMNIFERTSDSQLIIYASSGSLCNEKLNCTEEYLAQPAKNLYDYSKGILEQTHLTKFGGRDIIGLRFGTVFGHSQNFRNDTIFNKLFLQCRNSEELRINFPNTSRSFLAMKDLVIGIEKIIDCPTKGIFNLASFNCNFRALAEGFRDYFMSTQDIKVVYSEEGVNNYDFTLNIDKFKERFRFTPSISGTKDGIDYMIERFTICEPTYFGGRA